MKEKIKAAGILAVDQNSGKVLLIKRSPLCDQPNFWANVGGRMDPDETDPRITAIREFKEEVQPDEPYELSKTPFFIINDGPLKFYTYIGFFKNKFVPVLNEENSDYGWFDLDELPENLLPACKIIFKKRKKDILRIMNKIAG